MVGGCEKSSLTAWWASTDTSTPFWVRSKRSLNDASIVSVNTSVPTTNATPMTTANPVRTERSLRDSRPFSASFVMREPPSRCLKPALGEPGTGCQARSLRHGLHQVEHALGVLAGTVVHDD